MNRYVVYGITVIVPHFYVIDALDSSGRFVVLYRLPTSVFVGECLVLFSHVELEADIVRIILVYRPSFDYRSRRPLEKVVSGRYVVTFLYQRLRTDNKFVAYGRYVVNVSGFFTSVRIEVSADEIHFRFFGIMENEVWNPFCSTLTFRIS